MGALTYSQSLFALVKLLCLQISISQSFDQKYTGVTYTPYVKFPIDGTNSYPRESYTSVETRVMLEIILEKFSRVASWGAGSKNVPYTPNVTYYNNSYVEAHTSEIAARINLERGNKSITILQGVWISDCPQTETEVSLAQECVEKSNEIYPETVTGLVLSWWHEDNQYVNANLSLHYLKNLQHLRIKLGVRMDCQKIFTDSKGEHANSEGVQILIQILQVSNFIICDIEPPAHLLKKGALAAFESVGKALLGLRTKLQSISDKVDVMGQLKWPSLGGSEDILQQEIYWDAADRWGKSNNFTIWLVGAFDDPSKSDNMKKAHYGWWRLTDNSKSEKREGYIEKILEYKAATAMSVVEIVCIAVGIVALLSLAALFVILFIHRKRVKKPLPKEDIREFREGMSFDVTAQESNHYVDIALQFPYDNSIELDRSHLKIGKILGTGHFGRVHKAILEIKGQTAEVALKVAKRGCSQSTLKELLAEIKLMFYIGNHSNIVALKGAYTAQLENGVVYIAMELCDLGSLENYLRQEDKKSASYRTYENINMDCMNPAHNDAELVSFKQMVQWSQEIACGMEYLGTKNVVHADLATRNVLLTKEKTAKISDFGLSRRMYNYTNYIKSKTVPLPWRWMAIESLKWGEFSTKSDVWSFGVTLWEIFSLGEIPFSGLAWTPKFVKMLVVGTRLEIPSHATAEMYVDELTQIFSLKF